MHLLLPMPFCNRMTVLSLLVAVLLVPATHAGPLSSPGTRPAASPSSPSYCEDFAQRQISLADRLLEQSNFSRAVKVLNSTAQNCDRDFVREKLAEVLGEWFGAVRRQGSGALQQYINVLSNQSYLTSAQRDQLSGRVESHVRSLIQQEVEADVYDAAYRLCRSYPKYVDENFRAEYYCGTSALEVGAQRTAMNAYAWLLANWSADQSLATWENTANTLEELYFLNGRFREAYTLAREMAARDPTPKAILSSLISVRGHFLSPLLRIGAAFYDDQPSDPALNHVDAEMQRVSFPNYVKAFYLLASDGSVTRGMYGSEANQPSDALLETVSGSVSLLQSSDQSNMAWLVSPVGSRYLVLEFSIATTAEENVRLETIQENVDSDEQWKKLYQLEFSETSPASGSAIGTLLSGAGMASADFEVFDAIFDDSPTLTYYCIQNDSDGIEESYNFNRSNLGYGEGEWTRTSNTPALYHHDIQYNGQSVREVVWPKFVDENWTGVVRIGLAQN